MVVEESTRGRTCRPALDTLRRAHDPDGELTVDEMVDATRDQDQRRQAATSFATFSLVVGPLR